MFALLRSGNQRRVDLSELSHFAYNNEGPEPTFSVALLPVKARPTRTARFNILPLLCKRNDLSQEITYDTQRNAVLTALKAAGVRTIQATRINRRAGAQTAEPNGASPAEIARAGGWATCVMENVYLTNFSLPAMRSLAGFRSEGGTFYLP